MANPLPASAGRWQECEDAEFLPAQPRLQLGLSTSWRGNRLPSERAEADCCRPGARWCWSSRFPAFPEKRPFFTVDR